MEGIPGELIFVLIFIAFSVLEGLGRRKGAQRKGGPGQAPGPRPERRRENVPGPTPSGAASQERTGPSRGESATSEGLIPQDVWEEILGLARGTSQERTEPKPRPEPEARTDMAGRELPSSQPETLEEIPPFEARTLEPLEPRPEPRREMPDPSGTRGRGREPAIPPVPGSKVKGLRSLAAAEIGTGPGVKAVPTRKPKGGRVRREVFGDGSLQDLRKAVILKEVLGKPVGLRD